MTPQIAFAEAMKFANRANPYPFFDELRKTPVVEVGGGLYAVTGYRELLTLLHDPRLSSDLRKNPVAVARKAQGAPLPAAVEAYGSEPSFISTDPAEHDVMRRQSMRHFGPPHSPDLIPSMEPYCLKFVNDLLDKATGKTRIDVVDDFAYPLPVAVITKILGVPLADEPFFHGLIADFIGGADLGAEESTPEQVALRAKGQESKVKMLHYLVGLVEQVAKEPNDGMISKLVHDNNGPDGPMNRASIASNVALLLVAGHDSTVNLIAHCVLTCLRNPGSIELLRKNPEMVPRAVEEVLRLQSSVQFFPTRSALADIDIAGTTIPKGSPVFLLYGAANRDPAQFPNPNAFDPTRHNTEHLGWGGGIHVCFGGALARLEVNTAFTAFLKRVENPRLVVDPPPYRRSQVFRGPLHLQIDIDGIRDEGSPT
jgi:fatty acid omega-hydroxylase